MEVNKYQKTLMSTFIYWAVILFFVYIKFFVDMRQEGRVVISYTSDVCGMQVLMLGTICFISLISYPTVILEAKYLELKNWWRRIKPAAVSLATYFAIHLIVGMNPFVKYASFNEFLSNIATITAMARLGLIVSLFYVWGREVWRIWCLVPYYNRYIEDNFADSQCNVAWIRTLLKYISAVMVVYCTMLFFSSPLMNLIYMCTVMALFIYMIKMSLLYRTSEGIESVNIVRDPNNPKEYIVLQRDSSEVQSSPEEKPTSPKTLVNTFAQIDAWMDRESPYTSIHFSTNDILEAFPQFSRYDLTAMFRQNAETFQSYVRRFRIKKACEIMCSQDKDTYNLKIYAVVGFSHYSSFSRSFVSLLNVSPSNFMKLSDQERCQLTKKLRNNCDSCPISVAP